MPANDQRLRLMLVALPLALYLVLFLAPMAIVVIESFRQFVPGRIGSATGAPLTLANYAELLDAAYLGYFFQTLRLSLVASVVTLALSYPLAHHIARRPTDLAHKLMVCGLVLLLFMSALVKVFALLISLGPYGFGRELAGLLGTSLNSRFMSELLVVIGLFSFAFPVCTLMLVSTIQDVNPRFLEAAMALGANRTSGHLKVVMPLCARGFAAAFLVVFTLGISAFVIPMLLGRGKVTFMTTLIYSRFSSVGNFPSGAALAIVLLLLSLLSVYMIGIAAARLAPRIQEKMA